MKEDIETVQPSASLSMESLDTDGLISLLADGEGDTVVFCCSNPDFNGLPNECVSVNASWTNWTDRDFRADTRRECLIAAVAMKAASL